MSNSENTNNTNNHSTSDLGVNINSNSNTSSNITTNNTNNHIDIKQLFDTLNKLHHKRKQLLQSEIAPQGAWIHEYTIARTYPSGATHYYTYAKWQSQQPIFKRNPKRGTPRPKRGKDSEFTCHQHIGRTWSDTGLGADPEAIDAYEEYENRLRLEAIESALLSIQKVLAAANKKLTEIERHKRFKFE